MDARNRRNSSSFAVYPNVYTPGVSSLVIPQGTFDLFLFSKILSQTMMN